MPVYRFKLLGRDGTTDADLTFDLATTDDAAESAVELLDASDSATVQAWRGRRLVFTAAKPPISKT